MHRFHLTGLQKADISADRSQFAIELRTDQGPLTLTLNAEHLDHFITMLEGLEYTASLHQPAQGQLPGEMGQLRARVVDHHQMANGEVNGVPSVFIGLKTQDQTFRWFALDALKANALQTSLQAEIPKVQTAPRSH